MHGQFEVKSIRYSVTQGEAAVYRNGEKLIQYGDTIKLNHPEQHGPVVGGWASCIPDQKFIESAKRNCVNRIKQTEKPDE